MKLLSSNVIAGRGLPVRVRARRARGVSGIAVLVLALTWAGPHALGAPVTWETPASVTNVSDIDLTGELVHAGSWGSVGDLAVDPGDGHYVIFEQRPMNSFDGEAGATGSSEQGLNGSFFSGDTDDASFNAVLDSNAGGGLKSVTLGGLIPGAAYRLQLFTSDDRATEGPRTQKWSDSPFDGAGNESEPFPRNAHAVVVGTFVADATRQQVFGIGVSHPDAIVSGYMLRKTADAPDGVYTDPPTGRVVEMSKGRYVLQTTTPPASNITVSVTGSGGLTVSLDNTNFTPNVAVVLDGADPVTVYYQAGFDPGSYKPVETHAIAHAVTIGDGGDYSTSLTLDPFQVDVLNAPMANVGDMAVFNNEGAAPEFLTAVGGSHPDVADVFTKAVVPSYGAYVQADESGIALSNGKHLVLYNNRVDHVTGANRAELLTYLTLESAGVTNELAAGRAQGFIRTENGADEAVLSGGAIVEAPFNAVLRLHTLRSDVNASKLVQIEPGHTAVQLLKLDDSLDYLRLSQSTNVLGATDTNYVGVTYDTVEEASAGAMSFSAGSGEVTLNEAGRYLVLANTQLKRQDSREFTASASSTTRGGYTQRLALNGAPIDGSYTTTYVRGTQNAEEADNGVLAIGMVVAASAGDVLRVEQMKEYGVNNFIIGGKTALAVVRLPGGTAAIRLEDTRRQNINQGSDNGDGSPPVPVTFATQREVDAAFAHTASNSEVTVTAAGAYVFMGAFFSDRDTVMRQVVNQQWAVNGATTPYAESSQYSRYDNVGNNGNWSGALCRLAAGDRIEMTCRQLANGGVMPGDSMGLQGAAVVSLTTNPVLLVSAGIGLPSGATRVVTAEHLLTGDSDTAASNLVYVLQSEPSGGTLYNGATALHDLDTFTQADIDAGSIAFTGDVLVGMDFGFQFTVSDGGAYNAFGYFPVTLVEPIVPGGELVATDEDTVLSTANGATNLLANDTGNTLTVTSYDAFSTNRAVVVVNPDGSFTYDPTPAAALQQLGVGDAPISDTFTYQISDLVGETASATVTVLVSGVEDTFAAVDDYYDDPADPVLETAGRSFTRPMTDNDGIVRTPNAGTNELLIVNYDANAGKGARGWANVGPLGGSAADWHLGDGVTFGPVTSARGGITQAYSWDGSGQAVAYLSSAAGLDSHAEIIANGFDLASASIELWVKPGAADLGQVITLYETGGDTGTGIILSNGVLHAGNAIPGFLPVTEITYDLNADPDNLVNHDPTGEFFQIVFVMDLDNDLSVLYINGRPAGSVANPSVTDWDGGDGAGLGRYRGTKVGGYEANPIGSAYDTYFHGSMAVFRIYGEALSPADVFQNYQAIDQGGTDMEGDALTVSGVYASPTNLVTGVGVPVVIPSGATVTLDGNDGSFSYDLTGYAGLAQLRAGEIAVDSFDVQVTDGHGQLDTETARVVIHGVNQAADDTREAREGQTTTFKAGELAGNDQHTFGAPDPFIDLDAGTVTASNIAAGVWINTGSGGAGFDGTVNRGVLTTPASGFGAIGAAWEDPGMKLSTLDSVSAADATFELWFRPTFGATGRQVLFEAGGNGNGLSIVYDADANLVTCTADCGTDTDPAVQLRVDAPGISLDEFTQLAVVYRKNTPTNEDSFTVYVNDDPASGFDATPRATVTNSLGGADDFAGTDASGIGEIAGTAALAETPGWFRGQLAIVRVYTRALSTAELAANFNAAAQPIRGVAPAAPATTALGATVTLNADGSVTYDATALATNIPAGAVVQDSFSYTIDDGVGGTAAATVTVNVTGIGTFAALDDAVAVNANGGPQTFDPRDNDIGAAGATIELQTGVTGLRADFESGSAQGDVADFSGTSGWRYLWNAPADWNGTNSSDGTTGPLGDVANYELLKWDATNGRWTTDGDTINTNGVPGMWVNLTPAGGGHPGPSATENEGVTNIVERFAIAAYTVSEAGYYGLADATITKVSTANDAVKVVTLVNSTIKATVLAPPATPTRFDQELGWLDAGDSVYVGVGANATRGNDGFTWDFTIVKLPAPGSTVNNTIGVVTTDGDGITYDPAGHFAYLPAGSSGFETFSYGIVDGTNASAATVTIEIVGENDAPVGVDDPAAGTTDQNTVLSGGALLANDIDVDWGDPVGLRVGEVEGAAGNVGVAVTLASGATLTLNADGTFEYDPNGVFDALAEGASTTDSFSYRVEDAHGLGAANTARVTVAVGGLDDGVVATENAYEVKANEVVSGNLIADDTGAGVDYSIDTGDVLSVLAVDTNALQGRLTIGAERFIGTRGLITNLTDATQTIVFDTVGGRFSNPVVFANPPSFNESEPTIVVVSNVTATTFDISLKEQPEVAGAATNDMDGATHAMESVTWVVLEKGRYQLGNGAVLEVGTVETAAIRQDGGPDAWQTVTFSEPFTNAPVVFNQIQTVSGSPAERTELFGTRMNGTASTVSFEVALEDYQGDTAPRSTPETIGWLAIEPGAGRWSGAPYEAGITGSYVKEVWYTINFATDFSAPPSFLCSQATIAGVDPTQLRYRDLTGTSVGILGSEDTIKDAEVAHAAEQVTYLAIGGTGDLTAHPAGTVQGDFTYDPNGAFDGLAVGQTAVDTFTYTLTDGHGNTDTRTVTITVKDRYTGTLLLLR